MPESETRAKTGNGFVFATKGQDYTTLARRAARNLRKAIPDAQIDLLTDRSVIDDVFDRIAPVTPEFF